jgi:hypothetical protein
LYSIGKFVLTSSTGNTSINFSNDNLVKTTTPGSRPSIAPRGVLLERGSGRWYYEVTVVTPGNAYVGFGDALYTGNSSLALGIGDDDGNSWGYSGYLCKKKHAKKSEPYGFAWSSGDVIGCLVDMNKGEIIYSLNGSTSAPLGIAYSNIFDGSKCIGGMTPIISFDAAFTFRVNLGTLPFRHTPPGSGTTLTSKNANNTRSIHRWLVTKMEQMYADSAGGQYGKLVSTSGDGMLDKIAMNDMRVRAAEVGADFRGHAFPSCIIAGVMVVSGKWYYEIDIVNEGLGQLGWCDLEFSGFNTEGVGIGDDKSSWGIDGSRKCTWHNGSRGFGRLWKTGDTIGIACDLNKKSLSFSLNGNWSKPFGVAYENIEVAGGLSPGFTVQGGHSGTGNFRIKLGGNNSKLKYKPPDKEYREIQEWIIEHAPADNINYSNNATSNKLVELINGETKDDDDDALDDIDVPKAAPLMRVASRVPVQNQWSNLSRVQMRANSGAFQINIKDDGCVKSTGVDKISYPSIVADAVHLTDGKWYYEVTVLNAPVRGMGARCSIGWSDKQFVGRWNQGKGVGDDVGHSYGVFCIDENNDFGSKSNNTLTCNLDNATYEKQNKTIKEKQLRRGDVLSFLLDLDTRSMRLGINGSWL